MEATKNSITYIQGGEVITVYQNGTSEVAPLIHELSPRSVKCCHCNSIYDITKVEVIHRFADCSVFKTPCCNLQVDDRLFKSSKDFEKFRL